MRSIPIATALLAGLCAAAHAGPFDPAAGQAGSLAISKDSALITNWATGWQDYVQGTDLWDVWKTPEKALGKAVGDSYDIVSLGNGGSITLTFGGAIVNGAGADFAVFENSFSDTFLELGRVEVSSNGVDFFRFPAISFTPSAVGAFGSVDPTNITGFAGKYRQGFGTPFDLDVFANTALDLNNVRYVRIVDVLGNGTEFDDYPAIAGGPHAIYDPFRTVQSGGFDLDAIGVIHFAQASPVPEPASHALLLAGLGLIGGAARRRAAR